MSRAPVIVLGLDAFDPELLRQWALEGWLPNLHGLLRRGTSGSIRGLEGFFIGSTWPSFYTGFDPAGHGFHYQHQLKPGSYELYPVAEGGAVRANPVWRNLSHAGKRVAVLDVPLSSPESDINGIQLIEWGCHDELHGLQARPASLVDELLRAHGQHPIGSNCDGMRSSAADYRAFIERLLEGIKTKASLTRSVLARERWDFFMQVFSEAHCAGHQCWHLHDRANPAFEAELAAELGDPIRAVYRALDAAIGEILPACRDAVVIVVSPHGMASWYGAQFMLSEILFRLGVSVRESAAPAARSLRSVATGIASAGWQRLPGGARTLLSPLRALAGGNASPARGAGRIGVAADRSACFALSNGMGTGGIRLNLAGREPRGMLHPGTETEDFVRELSRKLLAITDAASGVPLINRVLRTSTLYDGPCLGQLPDLVVEWNRAFLVGSAHVSAGRGARIAATSPELGVIEGINRYGRTGEHHSQGIFVAVGPHLSQRELAQAVSVLDFTPTICELLGVPCKTQGAPIHELVPSISMREVIPP